MKCRDDFKMTVEDLKDFVRGLGDYDDYVLINGEPLTWVKAESIVETFSEEILESHMEGFDQERFEQNFVNIKTK